MPVFQQFACVLLARSHNGLPRDDARAALCFCNNDIAKACAFAFKVWCRRPHVAFHICRNELSLHAFAGISPPSWQPKSSASTSDTTKQHATMSRPCHLTVNLQYMSKGGAAKAVARKLASTSESGRRAQVLIEHMVWDLVCEP
jgi:hypothetical protein